MDNKFSCQSFCYVNPLTFKPEEYFKEYHFYEVYNENKTYIQEEFKAKYGTHKESTYQYRLYHLGETLKYVIAEEILTEKELTELSKYCQCIYHTTGFFNPKKLFIYACGVGCLRSGRPSQSIINESRKYRDKQLSKRSFMDYFRYKDLN